MGSFILLYIVARRTKTAFSIVREAVLCVRVEGGGKGGRCRSSSMLQAAMKAEPKIDVRVVFGVNA